VKTANLKSLVNRVAAIALLLALLFAIKSYALDPTMDSLRQYDEAIAGAQDQLSRLEGVAAQAPKLREAEAALRQQLDQSPSFLRGSTEALVGAALQEKLRGLITAQGMAVNAIQWSSTKGDAGLSRVAVRVQLMTTLRPLYLILASIETAAPVLIVDDLEVQAQATNPDPAAATKEVPLSVSFECYGYWPSSTASR